MKKYPIIATGLITSAILMMAAGPAMAGGVDVDVNIGVPQPPVYVQPRPVYVQPPVYVEERPYYIAPEREREWRERHARARQWQEEHRRDRHDDRRDHDRGEHRGHDD